MDTSKLIGLIEVTGSHVWSVSAENYGGPRFEKREFFQSAKSQCHPEDAEEVTCKLNDLCEAVVRRSVVAAITEYRSRIAPDARAERQPAPPANEPAERVTDVQADAKTETPPTPPPAEPKYKVGEKPATEPKAEIKPQAQPAPTQAPPPAQTAEKPQVVIANRLLAQGVTQDELKKIVRAKFGEPKEGQKFTAEQYVQAFTEAESTLKELGMDKFRQGLAALNTQAKPADTAKPVTDSVVFSTDPAVVEAMKQINAKWPLWGVELSRIAALWCADHVKNAEALEAFLITAGITSTSPPGRIEGLLSITRHLSIGALPKLNQFAAKTRNPFSMIEADLDKAIGKPIRWALDLPREAVAEALDAMIAGKK